MYPAKGGSYSIRYYVCNKDFFSLIHETQWEKEPDVWITAENIQELSLQSAL